MTAELIGRARRGDEAAFGEIVDRHRRELHVHCYRILGSLQDADDALQETFLAAWKGLSGFEERSSLRTWLYRIATRRCLNMLRSANRRPPESSPRPPAPLPDATGFGEVVWLEPFPDQLLDQTAGALPGPEARYETGEAISLAFVTTLQLLPPRQRAVLVLRDVLGFRASEAAHILEVTEEAVTSALKRARAAVARRAEASEKRAAPPEPGSAAERDLLERLARAYESDDIGGLIALLTEDVRLNMPPVPFEYRGRLEAEQFLLAVAFHQGRSFRLLPTRANGQPAFGLYVRDPASDVYQANGLLVLVLEAERISEMARFDPTVLPRFGLPEVLSD
ncbi:MAG: polymerase, sigma-24 subunit, subfamily [Acidimicrobiaceae bacterium]|nr:polymerase, sigma-24 subunit, subfamily [Acidimicrobiaceae bacterium]